MRFWVRMPVIATICVVTTGVLGYAQKEPTADQAMQGKSDRDIMQQIRKSIMDDKALSMSGHNVKVISRGGKVTLRGAVSSEEEKSQIESKATEVAGAGNVTNHLTVKASKSSEYK